MSAADDATQSIETEIGLSRDDAIALVDALKRASIDEAPRPKATIEAMVAQRRAFHG